MDAIRHYGYLLVEVNGKLQPRKANKLEAAKVGGGDGREGRGGGIGVSLVGGEILGNVGDFCLLIENIYSCVCFFSGQRCSS